MNLDAFFWVSQVQRGSIQTAARDFLKVSVCVCVFFLKNFNFNFSPLFFYCFTPKLLPGYHTNFCFPNRNIKKHRFLVIFVYRFSFLILFQFG